MKLEKMMVGGKFIKCNGRFVRSVGYFAYDGCHKIYILESKKDVDEAMHIGYYLYPIENLQRTYIESCPLKFISKWDYTKKNHYYVEQGDEAKWEEV